MLENLKEEAEIGHIHMKVEKVPEILKNLTYINILRLDFTDRVVLPEWMDAITIDTFIISGIITRKDKEAITKRFPNCTFF